tara:strand:- start:271 stop:615 length:345 start_codon:yes stop_codon:yes gene_type:complete
MTSTTDPRAYSNPDRFEGGPDPILESIFNEFVGSTVQDLFQHIKEIRDINQTLKKENKTLQHVMSNAGQLLECTCGVLNGQEEMNDTLKKENDILKHVMTNAGGLLERACSMVE